MRSRAHQRVDRTRVTPGPRIRSIQGKSGAEGWWQLAVRDAGPRSPRGDAEGAEHEQELRKLRARWRTASLANGWRFPSDWPLPEVDEVCASLVERSDVCRALGSLGRARALAGAGLEETLIDLAALHAVVTIRPAPTAWCPPTRTPPRPAWSAPRRWPGR